MAAGVAICTFLLDRARAVPGLGDYVHLLLAMLFLGVAVQMSQRQPDGLRRYGLQLGGLLEPEHDAPGEHGAGATGALGDLLGAIWYAMPAGLRALRAALLLAAVVFPPFVVGFWVFHGPDRPFTWAPPPEPGSYLLSQLLVVALPEEALFRGYFQGRLQEAFPRRVRLLGASLSPTATLLQCGLFALLHFLVAPHPARLAVFFPALLFTWLSARCGGIGAAIVFHALCNVLSDVLVTGWL